MKKIKNLSIIFILLYIILQIILNSSLINKTILFSYNIFIYTIVPNLFPFLIISRFLINYGFVDICYKIFNPIMNKIFRINGNASFIFIMSMLTGFPSNSKYTKELLDNDQISSLTGTKVLMFTHFSNPLFVIGTIESFINLKTALIILFSHYIGNIIIGFIFRNAYLDNKEYIVKSKKRDSFGLCLSKSVKGSIDTLLLIFGTMTIFLIISNLINNILNLSSENNAILAGILEFTQGLKYVSLLDVDVKIKAMLMGSFISFGGLSVHAQILSIIGETDILYIPFLISRILHSIITSLIIYLIL
ncbi:MAG: hypothetical protein J6G98_04765 [Bacilli bacterium]|nr:hypothetical protein [Bacilli bacterium]